LRLLCKKHLKRRCKTAKDNVTMTGKDKS